MSESTWPELSWDPSSQRVAWLVERTAQLARRARAFERALEEAQEAGEAPLSKAAEELDLWERTAANVFMYVGLGEARQVAAEDVPAHAEELAKVWANLGEMRQVILGKLGEAAQKVLAREALAEVADDELKQRAGELPSFGPEVDQLGAPIAAVPVLGDEPARPITGEEFRQRQVQEAKTLPEPPHLEALLASLPAPWMQCVFDTLGLELPDALLGSEDPRTVSQRKVFIERLDEELLRQVVYALGEQDRALLGELVAAGGQLRYADVTGRYGRDDADGFFWMERPPSGPVSRLRRVGLGYVGMANRRLVLQAPVDLLPKIGALLEVPKED